MFLEVCREFWGIWKCGKKMPKWPFLPFLSKKCWKGHFCKFCWKDLPNGICKAHRSLDSKMIRVYWKRRKLNGAPKGNLIMNEGFTQNLNDAPTKLAVIAYNTNITYIFLVDDPMEMTGWCIHRIYLIYSSSVARLNWLVCECTFEKKKQDGRRWPDGNVKVDTRT